jgi:hypothetical protein
MTSLPPAYDDNGDVRDLNAEELYRHWAKTFLMDRAGGWDPESIPGIQARIEFEAFIRETQARAVEAFIRAWDSETMSDMPWWVETRADRHVEQIRAGQLDLSGNPLPSST